MLFVSKWDLTFSWMALRFDGCTKTLYPIFVNSLTCFGARGALLSHALTSSLLIASTDLRWCQRLVWWNTHLPFVWLKARSMVKPDDSKDKVIKQYRYMYNSDTVQKFWSPLASAVKHKSDTSYSSYTLLWWGRNSISVNFVASQSDEVSLKTNFQF